MKIRFASLLLLLTCSICWADNIGRKFEWQQAIEGADGLDQIYRVAVSGKIFAECYNFPHDMRILDKDGQQLPFFVWTPEAREKKDVIEIESLNLSHFEGPPAYWRQDLSIPPESDGGRRRHNRVTIRSSGRDFIRRVEILASADQREWSLLGSGFLISMRRPTNTRNETIQYPESNYHYLQIRVYSNAREGIEEFKIQSVMLYSRHQIPGRMETVPLEGVAVTEEGDHDNAQVYIYDTGFEKRPVKRLIFEVADEEYARAVRVYRRDKDNQDWIACGSGEIHSLHGSLNNKVDLRNCKTRFLKVEVYHYDDKPLSITRVTAKAVSREIIFQASSLDQPSLYYGAEFVDGPHYDLDRRVERHGIADLPTARLGKPVQNASFTSPGYGRFGPWLAGLAIALVSILVIKVITDMMKQQNLSES